MCDRRSSVLGGVGQRLGDDVVRGDLDWLGQAPLDVKIELDWNGRATGERLDGGTQAAIGEDRGMDTAGKLPKLLQGTREVVSDPCDLRAQLGHPRRYRGLCRAEVQHQ